MKIKTTQGQTWFTDAEREILSHRLDVGCAIADVLCDTFDDYPNPDEVRNRAFEIWEAVDHKSGLVPSGIHYQWDQLSRHILAEAVDGSTMPALVSTEYEMELISRQKYAGYQRKFRSIEHKMKLIGIPCEFPDY